MSRRHSRRRDVLTVVLAACAGTLATAGLTSASSGQARNGAPPLAAAPPSPVSAEEGASHRTLLGKSAAASLSRGVDGISTYAPIVLAGEARLTPGTTARIVGRLSPRTPEGTTTIVPVIRRTERAGALWVEVGVPVLPNGTTGWVQRKVLGGYGFVGTRLEISLRGLRATLYRGSERIFTARIGIGRSKWPTPTGRFIIRNKLTKYASATYGPVAFGTSARSAVLTDWPAGGFVGIHGTDQPRLIPGQISHGCIRLRNADILRLAKLMPIGTPITVR